MNNALILSLLITSTEAHCKIPTSTKYKIPETLYNETKPVARKIKNTKRTKAVKRRVSDRPHFQRSI